jgi:hypothetical protein
MRTAFYALLPYYYERFFVGASRRYFLKGYFLQFKFVSEHTGLLKAYLFAWGSQIRSFVNLTTGNVLPVIIFTF